MRSTLNRRCRAEYIAVGAVLFTSVLLASCTHSERKPVDENPPQIQTVSKSSPPDVSRKNDLYVFLDSLEHRYETACIGMGTATWNSYSKEAPFDLDAAKSALTEIFSDTTTRAVVEEWRAKASSLADRPLARRLELWHRCFLGGTVYADSEICALEDSLRQEIGNSRFSLNGTTVTRALLAAMLRDERNQSRRHAIWSAPARLAEQMQNDVIRLIELRNARARESGFPNFYSFVLYLQGIDEGWLLETLATLEEETRPDIEDFVKASQKKLHVDMLRPWDFDYALREPVLFPDRYFPSDSVINIVHRFESGIGFGVDTLPIQEVVHHSTNGGCSVAIDIPTDCRVLLSPAKGIGYYAAALRGYGRAMRFALTSVDYPILKGYEWISGAQCPAYCEGVAEMHAAFTDDSLWLATFTNTRPKQIVRGLNGSVLPALYRLRHLLYEFAVEYEMYKDPTQDAAATERAMTRKYLLVDPDSLDSHQFAASMRFVSSPCTIQNDILASMIAAQLQEALTSKFGSAKCTNPKMAAWITEHLYADGESEEWTERIRNATGKSLEPGAYLRTLGIAPINVVTREE